MPPHRRPSACISLAVLLLCVLVGPIQAPAKAQEPAPVEVELVSQPIWHEPGGRFNLRLRITNHDPVALEGFRLQLRVFDRALTRSDLHNNFDVDPTRLESDSLLIDRADVVIEPGGSTTVVIDERLEDVPFLAGATDSGVYPLTVTVADTAGLVAFDTLTTQLIYLPTEVEVPLSLAFVWPLSDLPSRSARGVFEVAPETSTTRLEEALGETGWLTGIAAALASPAGEEIRFALAPTPRLIEELADMVDGYERSQDGETRAVAPGNAIPRSAESMLDRIRATIEAGRAQSLLVPYSFPDLPSLADLEQLSAQLTAAESVLEEILRTAPSRAWVFPPAGRLDEPTLERLHASGAAASTFIADDSLEPAIEGADEGCPGESIGITYTCPVSVTTAAGRARGFVLDHQLQDRFAALKPFPGDPLLLQQLFAETAMIWAELPGAADRVLALTAPPMWHPPPRVAMRFVRGLARAPWIDSITPRRGLHLGIGAVERTIASEVPDTVSQPDETQLSVIGDAMDVVDSFARMDPPPDLVRRLKRDVLVAQSRLWWGDPETLERGVAFAEAARNEAMDEFGKISVGGREDITLTSSNGQVPLVLENDTAYDVTLEVHIESDDRDLEISERLLSDTFEPGATSLPIEATARASGIYPVSVRVTTSDGYEVSEFGIRIRSTEFNEIALGITVGALAFLVLFYVFRSARRRRIAEPQDEA